MDNQELCTRYEAAAAWDLGRNDSGDFDGLTLVLDLDRGGAGICRCQPGEPPKQIWERPAQLSGSFYQDAVWTLMPGCADPDAERLLREALTGLRGVRAQKNYLRSQQSADPALPSVVVDDQVYDMTCAGLAGYFDRTCREPLQQMLNDAREQLAARSALADCRIIPAGALAQLFLAEYLVRKTFLPVPMLPDDRLRLCAAPEDPAGIFEQGVRLYRQNYHKVRTLGKDLRLQVLRRAGSGTATQLMMLAAGGSTCEQLRDCRYVGPVCIASGQSLTIFADSDMHQLRIPADTPGLTGQLSCVQIGVMAEGETIFLSLRAPDGKLSRLSLDGII